MLKVENIDIYGWEAAIRGMRNPMNSWDMSDSGFYPIGEHYIGVELGDNDYDLMTRLAKAGSVHAKYRRMINVTMDITAPLYWWKEFDTYKVGTVANSCSTMHKIQAKEFTLEDFSVEYLIDTHNGLSEIARDKDLTFIDVDGHECYYTPKGYFRNLIKMLNHFRELYLQTKDKLYWWQMIQLLPSSYNQRRTVQLNYEVLSHIYHDRKDHKLNEWNAKTGFCHMLEQLPYADELIVVNTDIKKVLNEEDVKRYKVGEDCVDISKMNDTGIIKINEKVYKVTELEEN